MKTILKLNRNFQRIFFLTFMISLFIFSSYQSGFSLVLNDMKKNSPYNTNDIIEVSKTTPTFLTNNIPESISKKYDEAERVEESTHVFHSGKTFDGYNAFQFRDFSGSRYDFRITDMNGTITDTFWSRNTFGYGHLINSTTILVVAGPTYFWNFETDTSTLLPLSSHHDISYNPRTKTFMTLQMVSEGIGTFRFDNIREINMMGDVIWQLNTSSFVPLEWWSGEFDGGRKDLTHANSVFWDIEEDMIYLNCRNLNTFFKIDHSTGEVVWGLGEHGNFKLYDHKGRQRQNLFYHAHALEKVDDNTFIIFDNDYLNLTDSTSRRSQILEITIDETTMNANVSWFWAGADEYYSSYWGDADRLPNGNRFGSFGTQSHIGTDIGPRFVEVNETGDVVWEMYYTGGSYGVYKAERFRLSPILNSPEDIVVTSGDKIELSWQTWYNFRTILKMNGSYILYQDGQAIDAGNVVFNQFWRPTNLTFDVNPVELGEYNLTLLISDEGGHVTTDTVIVRAENVIVYREGPTQVELGQKSGIIRWRGASAIPFMGEIYANNTLMVSFSWDGSDIELDLNSLILGKHNISFQLFANSKELYRDTFWVTVHSSAPPVIISRPDDLWVWPNQTNLILKWEVSDLNPLNYSILSNDLLIESGPWDGSDITINLSFSTRCEILVTLILFDILRNSVEDNVIIGIRTTAPTKATYSIMAFLLGLGIVTARRRSRKE